VSFILDALKKSDHKRQRGTVPDLLTVHDPMPQQPKKRSLLSYLFLVALLLNAIILAVWLHPWQSEKPNIIAQSTVRQQHESAAVESGQGISEVNLPVSVQSPDIVKAISPEVKVTEEESLPKPDITVATPAEKPVNVVPQNQPVQAEVGAQKKVLGEPSPTVDVPGAIEISPTTQEQVPVINHSPAESQPPANIEVASEQRVFNLHELPLSIQQDLPDLTISGHIYSNKPTLRIVNINGQILREGESVAANLKLEEITSTGIILSYQGFRFRMRGF
jgi:general secretion pathway protein B